MKVRRLHHWRSRPGRKPLEKEQFIGVTLARYAMALAMGRGNTRKAMRYARKKKWKEVRKVLKGSSTKLPRKLPDVPMPTDFLDFLRPRRLIGKSGQ